jgi:hypothetical protein
MLKLGGIGTLKRTKMTLTPHEAVGVSTGEALIVGFSMTEEGPTDELGITRLKVRWTTRATKRSHIVDEVGEGDGGGGRGRGREEFNSSHVGRGGSRQNNSRNLEVGLESEFPALPPGTKAVASSDDTDGGKKDLPKPIETPQPPAMATGTWADQVESSETPTKEQPTS